MFEANRSRKDLDISVLSLTDQIWFPKIHFVELQKYLTARQIEFKWFCSNEEASRISMLGMIRKLSKKANYRLIHILSHGLDPILVRLAMLPARSNLLFKHYFVNPIHKTFIVQKEIYMLIKKMNLLKSANIRFSTSSKVLSDWYGFNEAFVIPPAIDTEFFKPIYPINSQFSTLIKTFDRSSPKIGDLKRTLSREIILLYMGPLTYERFPYKRILKSVATLNKKYSVDAGLIAVGRGFEDLTYLEEIGRFVKKNNLNDKFFLCLADLNEKEKVHLLNIASIFIYLFPLSLKQMSVAFPPIALLESMSTGKAAVVGGLPHLDTVIESPRNGILIRHIHDEKIIANALYDASISLKKISVAARATIETEYSTKKVSNIYLKILSTYGV